MQKQLIDDVPNGPCKNLTKFYVNTKEPDALVLLNLYLKRRLEFDMGQLLHDLLAILERDEYYIEDDLYGKLTRAFATEIAEIEKDFTELMRESAGTDALLPLCQNVWKGIQSRIEYNRERLLNVLLSHGFFVPLDLQPSITRAVYHQFDHFVPNYLRQLASERFEVISSTIRNYMRSKPEVFDEVAYENVDRHLGLIETRQMKGETIDSLEVRNVCIQ